MAQQIFFDVIARDRASSTFSRIAKSSDASDSRLKKFGKTVGTLAGVAGGAAIGAGLISFFKSANSEAREAQKVGALTNAVLRSTGGVAKVSAAHVGDLATAISNKVGIDDEAIQSGENLLLTFKKIRNEVGSGNKIFDRATRASIDLSAAGFGSISSASKMVGKALNDPLKGITALSRAGVTFTDKQKKQIKTLVETNHTLKAQKLILREVESQVHGSAAAQATAGDKAAVAIANLKEQIGTALLPAVDKLATFTSTKAVPAISKFVTEMQNGTGAGGKVVDVLKDVVSVGKGALAFFQAIPGPIKKFGIEGLIAYGVLRKLTAATSGFSGSLTAPIARTKQFYAEMTYAETRMGAVTRVSQRLGQGLMQAAGTGGMLLLADSTGKAGTKLGTLEAAAGGALSGAALGAFAGPLGAGIGAGIGGIAGATMSLLNNTKDAGDAARGALSNWKDYASTLDQVTGATTAATRSMAQQRLSAAKVLDTSRSLGISDRQMVDAVVKGGKARQGVVASLKAERSELDASVSAKQRELQVNLRDATDVTRKTSMQRAAARERAVNTQQELNDLRRARDARVKDINAVLNSIGVVTKAVAKKREEIAATRTFSKIIKELPDKKETFVRAVGLKPGIAGVVELARQIHLTPKDIKILLRENGAAATDAQVKRVQDRARALGKMAPVVSIGANTSSADNALNRLFGRLASLGSQLANLGKPKRGGGGSKGGAGSSSRTMGDAGRTAGTSYANGIVGALTNKRVTVRKALDRITDLARTAADKLANLREIRQGFLTTFSSDSIFGADLETTGKSIGGLLAFQQQQASKAAQLAADVQRVAGMGLSKSLISQLQQSGSSGAEQLHLLAGGSIDQIRQFNALNAQTQASLQAAGMTAGNAVRGGNINADISAAARQETLLAHILAELQRVKDEETIVKIDGEGVIRVIKKRNNKKGVRTADQLVRALT